MALTSYVSGLIVQSVPTRGVMKVDRFTASGTFTPPTGVTYAIAHIRGGGGGVGTSGQGAGGNSSVAFAAGTVSATGGVAAGNISSQSPRASAGVANGGQGAFASSARNPEDGYNFVTRAGDGAYIVAGGAVTPGTGIAVTVGDGGTAGTSGAAGGSGYVWIEYLA